MTPAADRAAGITDWFWEHLVRTDLGFASDLVYRNPADAPRYGSWHGSVLGHSVCLFSDYPMGDASDWIDRSLAALHIGPGPVPELYARVRGFLQRRPDSYWFLTHRLDNEVLSCESAGPLTRPISHFFRLFRDYRTVQTAAKELTLLSGAKDWLLSYEFDGEVFAVFFHAGPETLAKVLGCEVPDPLIVNGQPAMMTELVNSCRFGGNWREIAAIDDRYRLLPHEWRQAASWLMAGVTSAAENEQAREIATAIAARMTADNELIEEEPCH